jgi:hypothetical protein
MAGGVIFEKTIDTAFQGGKDKCLLIEPNYAYQVPFSFGNDWNDIKVGLFISFVTTGNGNENVAIATSDTNFNAGGTTPDTFTYYGLVKEGASNSLPLTSDSSGFIGIQSDQANVSITTTNSTATTRNKFTHNDFGSEIQGDNRLITSSGTTVLEEKEFRETEGNFNIVGCRQSLSTSADPEKDQRYFAYWGARYQVIDKNLATQRIRFSASFNSVTNNTLANRGLSDPSTGALVSLMNGIGEHTFPNVHTSTDGFDWRQESSPAALPDSLFFYNGFPNMRPRIHTWAVKKIN